MSTVVSYPHISMEEDGVARIGNSRYKVLHIAGEHYHCGWSAEELLRQHPDLRPEEIYSALTYFYDHYVEMVAQLHAQTERVQDQRVNQSLCRADLLARKQRNR